MILEVMLPKPVAVAELSLPPRKLSANASKGSSRIARSGPVADYRRTARWIFSQARGNLLLFAAVVRATFYWPDRRRRDGDNAAASLKPVWDGMQDSGLIANDAGLVHLPPLFKVDRDRPRVVVEVFDLEIRFTSGGSET